MPTITSIYALVVMGINRFRNINEAMGYQAGDFLLKLVADRMQLAFSSQDAIGRLGNDEFAIFTKIKRGHFEWIVV